MIFERLFGFRTAERGRSTSPPIALAERVGDPEGQSAAPLSPVDPLDTEWRNVPVNAAQIAAVESLAFAAIRAGNERGASSALALVLAWRVSPLISAERADRLNVDGGDIPSRAAAELGNVIPFDPYSRKV
jgi:hypothetical protein